MKFEAVLLGNAQDAGVPQIGCSCSRCLRARRDPAARRFAVSLGLIDHSRGDFFIIDATPDFREQVHLLMDHFAGRQLAGILLTHAHMGHYPGLIQLGPEAWNRRELPVYTTGRMAAFLEKNLPWSRLIAAGHIRLVRMQPGLAVELRDSLRVLPLQVPHRDEFSDTVAFSVEGPAARLFYCPDIDSWEAWDRDIREVVSEHRVSLLDASFFGPNELPGRRLDEIPHPLARDSVLLLAGTESEIRLIHLNHSNPLHDPGPEREWAAGHGVLVGEAGMSWEI